MPLFDPRKYSQRTPAHFQTVQPILFLMNGGTIDAENYQHTEEYKRNGDSPDIVTPLKQSLIPAYVKSTANGKHCSFHQMKMQDSQKFTVADTQEMAEFIRGVDQRVVIISYGTDAMAKTARDTARLMKDVTDKVVIFVGAMEPLSHGAVSDGYANLDFAVRAGLHGKLPPGVYVGMPDEHRKHQIFRADEDLHKQVVVLPDSPEGRKHKYFVGNALDMELPALSALAL